MTSVTVYQFEIRDRDTGAYKRSGQYATLEYISKIPEAVALTGLRWVVDADRVDPTGLMWPPEIRK